MLSNEPELRDRLKKPQSLVQNCETGNRRVDIAEFIAWIETGLRGRLRYTTRPRNTGWTAPAGPRRRSQASDTDDTGFSDRDTSPEQLLSSRCTPLSDGEIGKAVDTIESRLGNTNSGRTLCSHPFASTDVASKHPDGYNDRSHAGISQWQNSGFVNRRLRSLILPGRLAQEGESSS